MSSQKRVVKVNQVSEAMIVFESAGNNQVQIFYYFFSRLSRSKKFMPYILPITKKVPGGKCKMLYNIAGFALKPQEIQNQHKLF